MIDWDALATLVGLLVFLAALGGAFVLVKRRMKRGAGRVLVLLWLLLFVPPALGALVVLPFVFARLIGWR